MEFVVPTKTERNKTFSKKKKKIVVIKFGLTRAKKKKTIFFVGCCSIRLVHFNYSMTDLSLVYFRIVCFGCVFILHLLLILVVRACV